MVYYIVGAFLSENGKLVLNTSATHPIGMNKYTKTYVLIDMPFSSEFLGDQLRKVIQTCLDNPIWDESMSGNLYKLMGYKSQSKFDKEFLFVVINFIAEEESMVFTPTKKEGKGHVSNGSTTLRVPFNASDHELGQTLLDTFKFCKK